MSKVIVPGRLVNKANHYVIHKDRAGRLWIAPSDAAKNYQAEVAYRFLQQERREWIKGERLSLTIRLVNQGRFDIDSTKGVLDGIQQSGRIVNDAQFKKITIEHVEGTTPAVEIEVNTL